MTKPGKLTSPSSYTYVVVGSRFISAFVVMVEKQWAQSETIMQSIYLEVYGFVTSLCS